MDIFKTLSTGGAKFDKKRFKDDFNLFNSKQSKQSQSEDDSASDSEQQVASASSSTNKQKMIIPSSLDFFSVGAGEQKLDGADPKGKGKAKEEKDRKRKRANEPIQPLTPANLPSFLKTHQLKLTGTDVPMPLASWDELESRFGVSKSLYANLQKCGWDQPTPIQRGAMGVMMNNRDLLAAAPTGSGKTLAFLLPIFHHLKAPSSSGFRALIVSPTRELAQQIYEQAKKLSTGRKWKICVLTKARESILKQDPKIREKFDILITTPMRLVHALETEELDLKNVERLVLDEGDRLLEQGFLEQTDGILSACSNPNLRKALFSATLPAGVEEMAKTFMLDECRIIVGKKDGVTENIEQRVEFCGSEDGKIHALKSLIQAGEIKPPVLIFCQSIERAKQLYNEIIYDGLHVDVIHSERPKLQREQIIEKFKKGEIWILICTELLARGIDFKGVNLVINYDFPQTLQSYVHRIGRTGRAGRKGLAITFFTKDDAPYLKTVINVIKQSATSSTSSSLDKLPQYLLDLPKASKNQKKKLKQSPIERRDIKSAAGTSGVGRKLANNRREMIEASKKRKLKEGKIGEVETGKGKGKA